MAAEVAAAAARQCLLQAGQDSLYLDPYSSMDHNDNMRASQILSSRTSDRMRSEATGANTNHWPQFSEPSLTVESITCHRNATSPHESLTLCPILHSGLAMASPFLSRTCAGNVKPASGILPSQSRINLISSNLALRARAIRWTMNECLRSQALRDEGGEELLTRTRTIAATSSMGIGFQPPKP